VTIGRRAVTDVQVLLLRRCTYLSDVININQSGRCVASCFFTLAYCHTTALPCHFGTTQVWRVTLGSGGVLQVRAVLQEACYACRRSFTVSSVTEYNCAN